MADISRILARIDSGDPAAADELLPLVYDELRKLAAAKLIHEKPGQTLQATALVHEAYLRLVESGGRRQEPGVSAQRSEVGGQKSDEPNPTSDLRLPTSGSLAPSPEPLAPPAFDSRGHFFAAAAEAMRRILVDNARRKQTVKHGGQCQRLDVDEVEIAQPERPAELLAVHDALDRLEQRDAAAAQLVKLRYFSGLSIPQAADVLGVSARTADRMWVYARAWLFREIGRELEIDRAEAENHEPPEFSGVKEPPKLA